MSFYHTYISLLKESAQPQLEQLRDKILSQVDQAYREITGETPHFPKSINMSVDDGKLPEGKIAGYQVFMGGESLITVHPKGLDDLDYLEDIIKHELIHAAIGKQCGDESHCDLFQSVADKVGLEKKYQD